MLPANNLCEDIKQFLTSIFAAVKVNLSVDVTATERGYLANINGEDSHLLLSQGGDVLEAIEQLTNKCFVRVLPQNARIICDAEGFRADRELELHSMAAHAASTVIRDGTSFVFNPMSANERRIIHSALSSNDQVDTTSIDDGHLRRVTVTRKAANR